MVNDLGGLLDSAFIAPDGSNLERVDDLFTKVSRRLLEHLASADQRPPLPDGGSLFELAVLPQEPSDEEQLLAQLQDILRRSMNQANPQYIGHMDPMPSTWSILGELVAAGLNNNMLSVEMSPILSRLEYALMQRLSRFFGLGEQSGGVMLNGGTIANLQALAVARNHVIKVQARGLAAWDQELAIFASRDAHVSISKAAMVLGIGTDCVCHVDTDDQGRMHIGDLGEKLELAKHNGVCPLAIVATAGTTTTGSIDPLRQIADLARDHDVWLHVDAAYGGALQFSSLHRTKLDGIERADSLTFNPQKWLYVSRTCVLVLFRRLHDLFADFRVGAPYMRTHTDVPNLGELSIQGTRSTDVLKLWLSINSLGLKGCEQLIDNGCELAEFLQHEVCQRQYLEVAAPVETNLLCFRSNPPGLAISKLDAWNIRLNDYLRTAGFFLSLPRYRGHCWQRAVVLNPYTGRAQLRSLLHAIDRFHEQTTQVDLS